MVTLYIFVLLFTIQAFYTFLHIVLYDTKKPNYTKVVQFTSRNSEKVVALIKRYCHLI